MSLTAALASANTALSNASRQASVVSNNISGANVPGYARRNLLIETGPDGQAEAVAIGRATDTALQAASMDANSKASAASTLSGMYGQLEQVMGASSTTNPMAMMSALQNSLQQLSASPSNEAAATGVVQSAQSLVDSLHAATTQITSVRAQANDQLSQAVASMNDLLSQFATVNTSIVTGTAAKSNISSDLDKRDAILSNLSQYVGVSTVKRSDGSMALYTDSGVVMFDGLPRTVAMAASANLTSGTSGPPLTIDGVDVTSTTSPMQVKTGSIAALANIRDGIAVTGQSQLDEIARNLINAFSETDQSATPTLPNQPGLFTYGGAPAMPGNSLVSGLAGEIQVAASVTQNPMLIRDGGISSPNSAYTSNTTAAPDFSDRINQLINAFSTQQTFDPNVSMVTSASLTSYASSTMNMFESARQKADQNATDSKALNDRATQALSNSTGVNLDNETSNMLEIQRSYATAGKLIATIDAMFTSLLQSVVA